MPSIQNLTLSEFAIKIQAEGAVPPPTGTPLSAWQMERDDAPGLRFLYQQWKPKRHLEFGTWQGFGACLCLEACDASVWTINLPDGETKADGSWAYGERAVDDSKRPPGAVSVNYGHDADGPRTYDRTDAASYIGRFYREKKLGHRVCQIYCDSREWDTSAYPDGFFDSVLVDGGHRSEIVISDTLKALRLLRSGGLMIWHDYCPKPEILAISETSRNVVQGIDQLLPRLNENFDFLAWIDPSHFMVGVKK